MKQSIIVLSLALLVNCVEVDISSADGDFKAEYYEKLIGRKIHKDIKKNTQLKKNHLKNAKK